MGTKLVKNVQNTKYPLFSSVGVGHKATSKIKSDCQFVQFSSVRFSYVNQPL